MPRALPKLQRVAAYALILRDEQILLTRLASRISADEQVAPARRRARPRREPARRARPRDPRGDRPRRRGRRQRARLLRPPAVDVAPGPAVGLPGAPHRVRRVGAARRARAAGGGGRRLDHGRGLAPGRGRPRRASCPVTDIVTEALAEHSSFRMQRIGVYALIRRDDAVLLTRISDRGFHSGSWTLPGGGLDHGESPREGLAREVREECGVACEVGDLLDVHDLHFGGVAPSGRFEDFHGVHLLFRGHRRRRRRAAGRRGRRHHRRGRLGAPRRDRRRHPARARRGPRRPGRRHADLDSVV